MKNILTVLALALPLSVIAQDDLYFIPKKVPVKEESSTQPQRETVYYSGSDRDVDEYNRRGLSSSYQPIVTDSLGNDAIDFQAGNGLYPADSTYTGGLYDDSDDFSCTRAMSRFYDYYCYDPYFWYWRSPYWYPAWNWYSPWYYSWYDPWYYSWYPYHWHHGWGGWHTPVYYTSYRGGTGTRNHGYFGRATASRSNSSRISNSSQNRSRSSNRASSVRSNNTQRMNTHANNSQSYNNSTQSSRTYNNSSSGFNRGGGTYSGGSHSVGGARSGGGSRGGFGGRR